MTPETADIGSGLMDISYEPGGPDDPAAPEVCVAVEEVDKDSWEALEALEKDDEEACCISFEMCIRPVSILQRTSQVEVRSSKRGLLTPAM